MLCSANQAHYHERNLQPSFCLFVFGGVGKGLGGKSVRGLDMQVTRMVSTLYITIRLNSITH